MKDTRGACPVEQPSRAHMGSQNLSCSHRAIMHLHQVLCLHVMTVSLVFCVRLLIVRGHVSLIFIFALESLFFSIEFHHPSLRWGVLSCLIVFLCPVLKLNVFKGRGNSATVRLLFLGGLLFSQEETKQEWI